MDSPNKNRSKNKVASLPNSIFHSKNLNDPELSSRQWNINKEGFPPGMTVDELKQFRRKRTTHFNRPSDNLHVEEGSLKDFKTEYNRRFIAPSLDNLGSQRSSRPSESVNWQIDLKDKKTLKGEYSEQFMEFPRERPRLNKPSSNLSIPDSNKVPMDFTTEKIEKYIPFEIKEKTKSLRRNTALKMEGEFLTESESQHEYHTHGNIEKVQPIKRQPFLKIEGLFENLTSEQKEKYITYLNSHRPQLAKRRTELQLLGDLQFDTECSSKFADPGCRPRAMLRKRSTSLKLDGEADFMPEYQRSYTDLPRERPILVKPNGHLSSKGELDMGTENRSQFVQFPITPMNFPIRKQDNIQINGDFLSNPEYREKFISHGKSKSEIIRRRDNLSYGGEFSYETENSKYKYIPSVKKENTNLNVSNDNNKIDSSDIKSSYKTNTEYHSQFLDFPRSRPKVQKPSPNLKSDGPVDFTTEKRSQFHSYGTVPTTSPRLENLKIKNDDLDELEYKNRKGFVPKRNDSLPKNYPSFQVLSDNKSETPARTPGKLFQGLNDPRSPSPVNQPSYRLEVHNVDNKSHGFYKSPERVFPAEAAVSRNFISSESKEAAFNAAIKRRQEMERLTSPASRRNSKSNLDENGNSKAFQILDDVSRQTNSWSPRVWNDTNSNALTQTIVT